MMLTPQTRHVTRAWRASTDQDRQAGKSWYPDAHGLARSLDADVQRAAGIIAVLSPMTSWETNVRLAQDTYAGRPVRGLGPSVRKARAILDGQVPAEIIKPSPRARKVWSFWLLISDPTDDRTVCVDRHAYDIAVGRVTDDSVRAEYLRKVGAYETVAECYRRAARVISRETGERWTPAEIQATTWVYWRRQKRAG